MGALLDRRRAESQREEIVMKAYELKVLRELVKKPRVPKAVKERHFDIEDAIVEAGGERGAVRHG
jgi:hypothetical protein